MATDRNQALLAALQKDNIAGAIIHKPSNIFYLSGYTGEGLLVLAPGLSAIVTDFRYTEQAEQQAPGFAVHMASGEKTHAKIASSLLTEAGFTIAAFEDDCVTVAAFDKLKTACEGITLVPMAQRVERLRRVKDQGEIALIEQACVVTSNAFDALLPLLHVGQTELQVTRLLEDALYAAGAEGLAFTPIVATGPNGALPHAVPGQRVIEKGHMLTLDFGAKVGRYCADMTRTVAFGALSPDQARIYDTVLSAQLLAMDAIKPGTPCFEVDKIARDFINNAGYEGRFGHGLGHGLGIDIHEDPRFSVQANDILEPGIVITNEPGIYIPGGCGCRIEDTVLVTEDGCRRLTTSSKELITL